MGCVLSSILTTNFEELSPSIGKVQLVDSLAHLGKLKELEFEGSDLYCDEFTLDPILIQTFKENFGNN